MTSQQPTEPRAPQSSSPGSSQPLPATRRPAGIPLQRCTTCGRTQYPPRELCSACLADTLEWTITSTTATILAVTELHHTHEPSIHTQRPIAVALVHLDSGPTAVCFLRDPCTAGDRVYITETIDAAGRTVLNAAAQPPAAAAAPPR